MFQEPILKDGTLEFYFRKYMSTIEARVKNSSEGLACLSADEKSFPLFVVKHLMSALGSFDHLNPFAKILERLGDMAPSLIPPLGRVLIKLNQRPPAEEGDEHLYPRVWVCRFLGPFESICVFTIHPLQETNQNIGLHSPTIRWSF